MHLLDEVGDPERAVGVGQPVQVDTEDRRVQLGDVRLDVKRGCLQHPIREVDKTRVVVIRLEICGDAGQADRVHLELRGRRNDVSERAFEDDLIAKVPHRRRVQEHQIELENPAERVPGVPAGLRPPDPGM
jgi:hypothetical protein